MTVIIECISWLINVTDNNDARWKPEIKLKVTENVSTFLLFLDGVIFPLFLSETVSYYIEHFSSFHRAFRFTKFYFYQRMHLFLSYIKIT